MKKLLLFCAVSAGVIIFYSCVQHTKGTIVMEKTVFGKLPDGREVHQYAMTNKTGSTVKVITYGAIVTSLTVPDRQGKFEDVVTGYDSLQGYMGRQGGECGRRVCGRVDERGARRLCEEQPLFRSDRRSLWQQDRQRTVYSRRYKVSGDSQRW